VNGVYLSAAERKKLALESVGGGGGVEALGVLNLSREESSNLPISCQQVRVSERVRVGERVSER